MLGRKQSLKGEPVLADYGPEESLNESADIEWVNKVSILNYGVTVVLRFFPLSWLFKLNMYKEKK